MFVFNRSALAVVLPLALLAGAVFWSNRDSTPAFANADHARSNATETVARLEEMPN